jgi:hypothetical protein
MVACWWHPPRSYYFWDLASLNKTSVAHFLNAGDKAAAAKAFLNWEHPSSLRGRREAEMRQFLAP